MAFKMRTGVGKYGTLLLDPMVHRTWRSWRGMLNRAHRHVKSARSRYVGVSVHAPWLDFATFLADVGTCPSEKHSLDRHPNNDGNYEPGNVRWATAQEQALNRGPRHCRECGALAADHVVGVDQRCPDTTVNLAGGTSRKG